VQNGVDLVWLGMLITLNLQRSFLTPPFGWSLFFLEGVAPEGVSRADIYRGAVPFTRAAAGGAGDPVRVPGRRHMAAGRNRVVTGRQRTTVSVIC
jgi:hypothetical protein